MKRKFIGLFRKLLLMFSYPKKIAEAVNRAATPEEFDEILEAEWNT